jgi:radical SAM protein with 4Fe4S-binding SPASM domain
MDLLLSAFEQQLRADTRGARVPLTCTFEITPTCNLRCHFCYVALDPYKGPYLSTAQICSVLDKLEQAGVLWLTLTGGEVFSRRDFPEIYHYARRKGFLVTVFSNATMMSERIAELFREAPPFSVEVSIYGADAEHYERVTGIPGSFARFERGIALLQSAGVSLLLKHPASSLTEDHVMAIHEWCQSRGIPHKFAPTIENRHDGGQQPSLYRIAPRGVSKLRDDLHVAMTGSQRSMPLPECNMGGASDGVERLYQCGAGRVAFFVDALGRASHCVLDREPSFPLTEMDWDDVWAQMGAWVDQPLPKEAPCSGCSLRSGCMNCPARARMASGSPYLKDTYYCDVTHAEHGLEPVKHPDYRTYPRPLGACTT